MRGSRKGRLVWDLPLRLWHWLFACVTTAAWLSGQFGGFDLRQFHFLAGYWVLGLVIFRCLWGVYGTRHSRFVNFVRGPGATLKHLASLSNRMSQPNVGHSPLAALAALMMLTVVAAQAFSGLFISDDIFYEGPWHLVAPEYLTQQMNTLHHWAPTVLLILVGLHLTAMLFYTAWKRHTLIMPMIHGRKPAEQVDKEQEIERSGMLAALLTAAGTGCFVWWLVARAPVSLF